MAGWENGPRNFGTFSVAIFLILFTLFFGAYCAMFAYEFALSVSLGNVLFVAILKNIGVRQTQM